MLEVHFWSDSESPHGHWRWAVLCVGSWFEKQTLKKDCVSKTQVTDLSFFFSFQSHTRLHFHFIVYIDAIFLHVFFFFCTFFSCLRFVIPQVVSAFLMHMFLLQYFTYAILACFVWFFSIIALVVYGMLCLCLFLGDCIDFKALMHVLCNFVIALVIECCAILFLGDCSDWGSIYVSCVFVIALVIECCTILFLVDFSALQKKFLPNFTLK